MGINNRRLFHTYQAPIYSPTQSIHTTTRHNAFHRIRHHQDHLRRRAASSRSLPRAWLRRRPPHQPAFDHPWLHSRYHPRPVHHPQVLGASSSPRHLTTTNTTTTTTNTTIVKRHPHLPRETLPDDEKTYDTPSLREREIAAEVEAGSMQRRRGLL